MTTTTRTIETIEAEIELAKSLCLAADANVNTADKARFGAAAAADKALATARTYGGKMADASTYAATNIAAQKSFVAYDAAYEAAKLAAIRLQTLQIELAASRAR